MHKNSFIIGIAMSATALSMGCDTSTTEYKDFLTAAGTVYKDDGRTPAQNLAITNYHWVTTFSDGSTVGNPFTTTAVSTDSNGKFGFNSNQLQLYSGREEESCDDICVDWETGYEDVCIDWETSCDDYCADWEIDDEGNEYCADWETSCDDYCADWETDSYDYCAEYGQDCEYYYPTRSASDIVSAYSEITYNDGASVVTTQSEETATPGTSLQKTSVKNGDDTVVTEKWLENDSYISTIASTSASVSPVQTAQRLAITAKRNAGHKRIMKHAGTPHFGRTHKAPVFVPFAKLHSMLSKKANDNLTATRLKCNAIKRSAK
jgi:hypothetical protein